MLLLKTVFVEQMFYVLGRQKSNKFGYIEACSGTSNNMFNVRFPPLIKEFSWNSKIKLIKLFKRKYSALKS